MFIVSLLSNPIRREVTVELVDKLCQTWGGGEVIWLAPRIAAEFAIPTMPDNLWQVWEDAQQHKVDIVVQRSEGRRKKVLLADMDSTMIRQECIDELAGAVKVGPRVKEITKRAMNGELDFETSLRDRVSLLAGHSDRIIDEVLETRITMMPGAQALMSTMRANGAYTALVSGGFTAFAVPVAARLGFDEVRANTLLTKGGKFTGEVGTPILGREAKVTALQEITAARGLVASDVLAVGDGANDLGMLHLAGAGVALHAKPSVAAQCDIRINYGDLTALLYIQGYHLDEFSSR